MTEPLTEQSDAPTQQMYNRALSLAQYELREAKAVIAAYKSEIERLTQVCSAQAIELMHRRADSL